MFQTEKELIFVQKELPANYKKLDTFRSCLFNFYSLTGKMFHQFQRELISGQDKPNMFWFIFFPECAKSTIPEIKYMLKVNNRNSTKRCDKCLNLTTKAPEPSH